MRPLNTLETPRGLSGLKGLRTLLLLAFLKTGCALENPSNILAPGQDASTVEVDVTTPPDAEIDAGIPSDTQDAGSADAPMTLDTGSDTGVDVGIDTGNTDVSTPADTGIDTGNDIGFDAGTPDVPTVTDTGVDTGNDVGFDTGNPDVPTVIDTGIDTGNDVGFDTGNPDVPTVTDTGIDTGTDVASDTGTPDVPTVVDTGIDTGPADSGPTQTCEVTNIINRNGSVVSSFPRDDSRNVFVVFRFTPPVSTINSVQATPTTGVTSVSFMTPREVESTTIPTPGALSMYTNTAGVSAGQNIGVRNIVFIIGGRTVPCGDALRLVQ